MNVDMTIHSSSFRDPSGVVFVYNGNIFRAVNYVYQKDYDHLLESGLYNKLTDKNLLVCHEEINSLDNAVETAYKIIQPEQLPFISYPYEWCFSQYKDAALALLEIQKQALSYDMVLKDASAYNIQFHKGKPILIDTLSFEIYKEGQPWVAYRQFCQHFMAPLSLMVSRDIRLSQLMRNYIDGIPLDLATELLPISTWFNLGMLSHLHLHSKAQKRYENRTLSARNRKLSKQSLLALVQHLESAIYAMKWRPVGTEWGDYYNDTNYSSESMVHKQQLVKAYIVESNPKTVWDIGANTGEFSRIALSHDVYTIAFDIDPAAVEKNYLQTQRGKEIDLLPLCLDVNNPSPAIGWANKERQSLVERGPCDTLFALALVHHLAISNNVPFDHIAAFF